MNIGGYRPDGNIMTVPEIKEIVTEGVDISDLKDKVDTIQANVTTLNEAVGELETDLAETVSDLNTTKGNVETLNTTVGSLDEELGETNEGVSTNATNIATNTTDITNLSRNKVGKFIAGDEINYTTLSCAGFITNISKDIEFFIPDNRIDTDLNYTITDFGMTIRHSEAGYPCIRNGDNLIQFTGTYLPFVTAGVNVVTSIDSIVVTKRDTGLIIRVKLTEGLYLTTAGTNLVANNRPLAVLINLTITVS